MNKLNQSPRSNVGWYLSVALMLIGVGGLVYLLVYGTVRNQACATSTCVAPLKPMVIHGRCVCVGDAK
jgi:hypothetical protein